jgi:hypothetical protein
MAIKEENNTEESTERKNSKPSKKRGWPFWLVFFISAWMFFLGVIVGRGTSPVTFDINELEKKIAELKKSALQSEELRVQKASPVLPDGKSELEFYEALKMAEQTDPIDFTEQKSKAAVKPDSTAKPENTIKPEPAVKTKSVVKPEKMQEEKKSEIKPISPVSETSKTNEKTDKHYSIQVASLKDSTEADRLVEIFRKEGILLIVPARKFAIPVSGTVSESDHLQNNQRLFEFWGLSARKVKAH